MSNVPDAWEDEWATVADVYKAPAPSQSLDPEPKKISSKVTKAQKRAQQAEFNRQLWAEAEGPKQPNYFLESRNVVPLRQEFKPPPTLLSRKGPITQIQRPPPSSDNTTATPTIATAATLANLRITNESSSEDEDEAAARQLEVEERKAKASRDREEKQRKYEERRLELFGPTPPHSRSSTPNRGGRRGRGGGGTGTVQQPVRPPRGPDGSGGFANRGAQQEAAD